MPEAHSPPLQPVSVAPQEAGQKLLQFLQRRLGRELPQSLLMRWIRSGQVRVDGRRAKPFQRLEAGQCVRLPPQAFAQAGFRPDVAALAPETTALSSETAPPEYACSPEETRTAAAPPPLQLPDPAHAHLLRIVWQDGDVLALAKPAGLPTHGGSGHTDSVQARLQTMFPGAAFAPTVAHRLDRDTSGLLLAALSYTALRRLQECIQAGELGKEYLAWVAGSCPWQGVVHLADSLDKVAVEGRELVRVAKAPDQGKTALAQARVLRCGARHSLLHLRLMTGRTHQLRVQLAARGHPILGDRKYGGPTCAQGLLLHAFRLAIPGKCLTLQAPWTGGFAVPDPVPFAERPPSGGGDPEP